jgi:hypothetical protein
VSSSILRGSLVFDRRVSNADASCTIVSYSGCFHHGVFYDRVSDDRRLKRDRLPDIKIGGAPHQIPRSGSPVFTLEEVCITKAKSG